MSNRYKGGVISATPPTTTGGESGTASGAWTLEQQMQAQAAGLWPVAPPDPSLFIENLFSTYLYTGNGSTQTITNGINLSGQGGLVWLKNRTGGSGPHNWYTTAIGSASYLDSSQTSGLVTYQEALSTYNSDGFSLSSGAAGGNENTFTYASWTFRKQAKFFDVVTWTSTNNANARISHNLGSAPGCYIIKRTDGTGNWFTYHTSLGRSAYVSLNATNASASSTDCWGTTNPTSTDFGVNETFFTPGSGTYVAYLFAHDAGGFGLTGTDNVISCGSFTTDGSGNATVNLGYEPQWMLLKNVDEGSANWGLFDSLRGWTTDTGYKVLTANTSSAEGSNPTSYYAPTSTGIKITSASVSQTQIYIAIRRGPMKVPTVGTTVFSTDFAVATAPQFQSSTITTGVDSSLTFYTPGYNDGTNAYPEWFSRLTGQYGLQTANTRAQNNRGTNAGKWDFMNGFWNATGGGSPYGAWHFKRAPSFFDVVCYTGTGVSRTVAHNLTVVPGLLIVKRRDATASWHVGSNLFPNYTDELSLNSTASIAAGNVWQNAPNTTTYFTLATNTDVNASSGTYTAYLFATADGVSKVGLYTGTGAAQTINCGFAAGCRFVFIKRTDASGDWYVWDSTRGIVAGNDPYLTLNTYDAEVTNTDYIDTTNVGFDITSTAPAAINANGGTFIFLAIA
jgi:hypothetical protein